MKAANSHDPLTSRLLDTARIQWAKSVDGSSLAVFRICFGSVLVWHLLKYFRSVNGVTEIERVFGSPAFHFTYPGFAWVQPWSEPWLSVHFAVVAVAAGLVALGLFYRAACVTLFLGYTYIFLLEATLYNNHYYLICLIAFLMIFMPANRCWSLDRLVKRWLSKPENRTSVEAGSLIPFWPIFLLRTQLFLMYFYGGIAKINADWLTGEPLFVPGNTLHQFISSTIGLPSVVQPIHLCLFLAWAGLFYDLSIGFLLLWRKTRWLGLLATALFHLHNHFIFPIGIFPAMALSSTLIFLDPDWPRQLFAWLRRPHFSWRSAPAQTQPKESSKKRRPPARLSFGVTMAVCLFTVWQATWPLRHLFIEGDANWTEEGQDFSWRMMLRAKAAGHLTCRIFDPTVNMVDAEGRPQINWKACPPETARAVHVAIDSSLFQWSHHPGLTFTHEPIFGRRLIYHPTERLEGREAAIAAGTQEIRSQWQEVYAREPIVEEAISIPEAVALLRQKFEQQADHAAMSSEVRSDFVAMLTGLERAAEASAEKAPGMEPRQVQLVNALNQLNNSPMAKLVRPVLRRIEPFVLQGAPASEELLLVVTDTHLTAEASSEAELLKLSDGKPYIVWADFSRLRPQDWRRLPQSFVTMEDRRLNLVWNHFREIEPFQLEKAAVRPWMIHQYAQSVGQRWHAETGRRAEVRVESYVMMNYTVPQLLIDPQVDLTSVSLRTFGHNSWILPRNHQRLGIAEGPVQTGIRR